MIITGVVTLYTSNSDSGQFRTTIAQLMALGIFVILKPLGDIKQRKKQSVSISPGLATTLATMHQN
ncbi:hypothetical protein QMK33_19350 [Hymenobacter sp. H14-R3]|uniref:hypothetical protein n=1 Tax=Hymenobacter sp. H14-R3 TaxID=3046308 RepID=UPI0024BA4617|nr:hypothetical protein [Hymenobacter sp. H14-R3]MDJ0367310.1 hypothetical protein [Hymenobacter sp. H14-R3]